MGLFGTRRPAPYVEPEKWDAAVERCTACGATDMAFTVTPIPEYGEVTVCAKPAACRQRAQLAGVYGNPAGGARWLR